MAKGLADEVSKYAEKQASWEKRERELVLSLEAAISEKVNSLETSAGYIVDFEKEVASLKREISSLKAAAPKTSFSSVRGSLTMLVEQGLLTEEEAIQKFWKFSPKE